MKKANVHIGHAYLVKVSGALRPVMLKEAHPKGGWVGVNEVTGREVRIRSAARLRAPCPDSFRVAQIRKRQSANARLVSAAGDALLSATEPPAMAKAFGPIGSGDGAPITMAGIRTDENAIR